MVSLKQQLTEIFSTAFETNGLARHYSEIVVSQRPDLGQFQCNGVLAVARTQKKNPLDVARAVVDSLKIDDDLFTDLSVAGPGFINVTLSDKFLAAHIQMMASDERLGCPRTAKPKRVVVDFGGPNVAKPLHVGHLRSTIIGDCLQRLCRFVGDDVFSDIHLGDWGTPMGMLICELQQRQPDLAYFDPAYTGPYPTESPVSIEDLQQLYPEASAHCKADLTAMASALQATVELQQGRPGYQALWQHFVDVSVLEMKAEFDQLGVSFDHWFGESDYHERIPSMLAELTKKGQAQNSEGALIIPLSPNSDGRELPPFILVKSDGGYLYSTTDLATVKQRVDEFEAEAMLYVVDARQSLHFEQLFQAARQIGLSSNIEFEHIVFGTVNGPNGQPFKTRAGGVMRLKTLIEIVTDEARTRLTESGLALEYDEATREAVAHKVAVAALKFADLMNHRASDYTFDGVKFTRFVGRTGPYLLYTAVRIKSILRKADGQGFSCGLILPPTDQERDLMLTMAQLPDAIERAYKGYHPHHLCEFVYILAQTFNRFYDQCYILGETDPARRASWLALAQLCLHQMELVLSLLGIEIPERM